MKRPRQAYAESEESSGDEEMEDEEDDEDEDAQIAGQAGPRQPVYDVEGIHDKLEDFGWTQEVSWTETQATTTSSRAAEGLKDVDDDLARELAFYNQALAASAGAIKQFEKAGVAWRRPQDYFAEMVKSDEHMAKIKEQLMFEQRQIEQAEERRKTRESKQYSKQVQAEKTKDRAQDKKRQIEQISRLRKQREKSGFAGELDFEEEISKMGRKPQAQALGERIRQSSSTPTKHRQVKDAKYGFGGRKRLAKQNDASSAANMDEFKPSKFQDQYSKHLSAKRGGVHKKGGAAGGAKKKGGAGGAQRPGKARRQGSKQRAGK